MRQTLFTILFTCTVILSFGQLEEQPQIRATLFPLGVDSEFSLSDQWSINLDAALMPSFGFSIYSNTNGESSSDSFFEIYPMAQTSTRYYYNFSNRIDKGKKVSGNSGNYVGLLIQGLTSGLIENDDDLEPINSAFAIGPVWGLQRTYDSNIYLDLNIGVGYVDADYETDNVDLETNFGGVGSFAIGYAFGQN